MLKTLLGPEAISARAWISTSRATTARRRPSSSSCNASPMSRARTSTQFMLWYSQAGTPEVIAAGSYDTRAKTYRLDARPDRAADARSAEQGADGHSAAQSAWSAATAATCRSTSPTARPVERGVLTLTKTAEDLRVRRYRRAAGAFAQPRLLGADQARRQSSGDDLRFLAAHDSDPFNRWQAAADAGDPAPRRQRQAALRGGAAAAPGRRPASTRSAAILADGALEPAFVALMLTLAGRSRHRARDRPRCRSRCDLRGALRRCAALIGEHLARAACSITTAGSPTRGPYRPDAASAGRRALRNTCLDLLVATRSRDAIALAAQQYQAADNMTDRMAALSTLSLCDVPERAAALDDFYARYRDDPLIVDKWFALQAAVPERGDARPRQGAHGASRHSRSPIPIACAP